MSRTSLATSLAASLFLLAVPGNADTLQGTRSDKMFERGHDLSITFARGWARIVVQRTFENGADKHDQAFVHVTDLPPGAIAIGLRTQGTKGAWFDGELLEAELAAKRYQELTGIGGYYPKDPALLSWRSVDHLALQVFPVDPKGKKVVEYTLLVPTHYVDGRDVLELPRMGVAALAPTYTAKAENKDDRIELAGLPLKGSQPLLGPRTLELVRAAPPQLGGSFASIPVGKRSVLRARIEVAGKLSTIPKGAHVVVVIDTSRSMDDELAKAEVAAAQAYLSHFPDAKAQVVTFARKVTPLHTGWVSAAQASKDLGAAKLARKNGSAVDDAWKDVVTRLATAPADAPRRVLFLTDLRTKVAITPESLGSFEAQKGILHLAEVRRGTPALHRVDQGPWAKLPRASGGLLWSASISAVKTEEKLQHAAIEEWARPLRIDNVVVEGVGLPKAFSPPSSLAEGEGFEETGLGAFATPAIEVRGELWSKPLKTVLTSNGDEEKRAAALAFGASLPLTEPEMMVLALRGHAVSPVTSLLAIEPGVRPSTEGLDWDSVGEGIGFGGLGLIGHGSGGGGGWSSFDPKTWLAGQAQKAFQKCGGGVQKGTMDVEVTRDEIVSLRVALDGATKGDPFAACVEEEMWAVELPPQFTAEWANHRVKI